MYNNALNIIQQFIQFRNNYRGNPQLEIQRLMNSGRISRAQYDNAVQQAQMLQSMLMPGGRRH